jgi:predicted transposase/invertase (TIGR01784 family)
VKFVDITNDIAFRKIFGNDAKKKPLISFLNAVIDSPKNEQIVDVEIINPYQLGKLSGGNSTIVDVKAKDERGNIFIIEMQIAEFDFFHKRILYYTSQSYVSQIDKGIAYNKLQPVYFIGILEFEIGTNPYYFSRHKVLDVETREQVIQDIEFNFIELPKFDKTIDQLATSIDQWTYFIKNAENLTVIPEGVNDEGLKEAYAEADKQNWTKEELEDYERASIKERDELGRIEFAERKAAEVGQRIGQKIGEEIGQKIGQKIGEEIGEKKGIEKVAKNLKEKGIAVELIAQTTGLSMEEIMQL